MYVKESAIHDEVSRLVEWIEHEPDPIARVLSAAVALRMVTARLIRVRNAAAYTARQTYSNAEIEGRTGIHPEVLRKWVRRHREATGAPPAPRRATHRLTTALDASQGLSR